MKIRTLHIGYLLLAVLLMSACSTKKNTAATRNYHALTTRFNIGFNGSESYREGLENIEKANKDDYTRVIPMYPIGNKASATAAVSNMDRTIEKCRKAIKLHSIRKKPQKNYKKANDPKYLSFYNQNEFNPALRQAWMLLGQAEFHKGDFLGSVGTFSYIGRYYASVPQMVVQSQIWTARAYTEMDWLYEAEDVLQKINQDQITGKNTGLYAAVSANLMIKKGQYKEAIPFLKLAIENEKNKKLRTRFNFVMAQLQERTGDKVAASDYYTEVIKSNPGYELNFNARINRAQLLARNVKSIEKELKKMARNRNNRDYLDQIYAALGNMYLQEKDTVKAISNYNLALEKSKRNGIDKAVAALKLGELYYNRRDYVKAQPCYDEASKIFTNDYADYARISKRAEILGELVKEHEIIVLQDSLQALALLSDDKRLEAINRVIEKVKKVEKEEAENKKNPQQGSRGMNDPEDDFAMNMGAPIGGGNNRNWYFYNPVTINSGKADFKKKWGNRKLEDNWRRSNKSAALFADNTGSTPASSDNPLTTGTDSVQTPKIKATSDKTSVDYYLKQLPFTAEQRKKSDAEVADAMFAKGFIFKDKLEDFPMAYSTFEEFQRRFGNDERVVETLFQCYLMASKEKNESQAEAYRNRILTAFPNSKMAQLLKDPDYIRRQGSMFAEQDSLYSQTYAAYTRSDFSTVFKNTDYFRKKYPLAALLPKFEFLNALSIGKTAASTEFEKSLSKLVESYPQSDVSAMSKDILALMKQGNLAQKGTSHGTLLSKRAAVDSTNIARDAAMSFSPDKEGKHRLLLLTDATSDGINKLLYNLAIFNFSRFMIKDFDFVVGPADATHQGISVTNLESYDEVLWYQKTLKTDQSLTALMDSLKVTQVVISEDNFGKMKSIFSLDEYLAFEKNNLIKEKPANLAVNTTGTPPKKELAKKPATETLQASPVKEVAVTAASTTPSAQKTTTPSEPKTVAAIDQKAAAQPAKNIETTKTVTTDKTATAVNKQPAASEPVKTAEKAEPEKPAVMEEKVEWYKNLFAIRLNAPHFVAFYLPPGKFDFPKIQKALDAYNAANYSTMNLAVNLEDPGKDKFIIVGTFTDANVAKSYFMRMLKDPGITEAFRGVNRRNLVGTKENLNIMVKKDALNTYFEFMREYYLK